MVRMRNRRGAVMVWVGLALTFMLLTTAVVMDVAFWYVGQSELQTAADAAALRGARMLQLSTAADPEFDVDTAAVAFSPYNSAQGKPVSITPDEVRLAWWEPGATEPDFNLDGRPANAVVVDNHQPADTYFGRMFAKSAPTLRRRSVAWVANVVGRKCLKPWGFPMGRVVDMATGGANSAPRVITAAEVAALAELSPQQRTLVLSPPSKLNPAPTPDGYWDGLRWNDPNNGINGFQHNVGGACRSNALATGDVVIRDFPGNNVDTKTTEMIEGSGNGNLRDYPPVCHFRSAADASCYANASALAPGITTYVAYTSATKSPGTEPVTVHMIGEFVVTCYVRKNATTCNWPPYQNVSGYSEGTIIGYVVPNFSVELGPDIELGTTPSTAQRLLLVK